MCLIIEAKSEFNIPLKFFEHVRSKNSDGFGMMWIENNQLKIYKNMTKDVDAMHKRYEEVKEFGPYIHFRMRTHGEVDDTNCHPYHCGYGIYMMHNGVLSVDTSTDKTKSDTWHFVNDIIKPMFANAKNPHKLLRSWAFTQLLEKFCGTSSRLVFGDRGGFILVNANSWTEVTEKNTGCKGILVSNSYAWSESHFKKGSSWDEEVKKAVGKFNKNVHQPASGSVPWFVGACFVGDRFGDAMEMCSYPYYIDVNCDVWEKIPGGYKRRFDMNWDDLPGDRAETPVTAQIIELTPTKKEVDKDPPLQVEFELEDTTKLDLIKKDDAEEAKHLDEELMKADDENEALLAQMVEAVKKMEKSDIEVFVYQEPDDAAAVLCKLVKGG